MTFLLPTAMPASRVNEPITSFADGDQVTGFALVTKKELRQDRNGRDYLDLELADATGSLTAKAWPDSRALEGDFEVHDFVAFRGTVLNYRDQLQLNLKDCRRAEEADRQYGFDESLLVPSTRQDVEELYRRLEALYRERLERPPLQRLVALTLETHGAALRRHPAAKSIHHAYRGGLLEHVVSMAELAVEVADHYPELDRDLLLVGVLFHDLGKIRELGAMPVNEYTPEGRLVGHVVIGRDLLRDACREIDDLPADLQLQLEHLVLSHQGRLEFGSPVRPMTAEAIALHMIDDLDSKLAQLRQARQRGEGFQFLKPLGRYVWLGEAAEEPPAGEAEEGDEEAPQRRLSLGVTGGVEDEIS